MCLEGAICACNGRWADALECHLEKSVCVAGVGIKKAENKRLYSQPDLCKFVKLIICMIYVCPSEKENISNSISGTAPQSRAAGLLLSLPKMFLRVLHGYYVRIAGGDWQGSETSCSLQIDPCSARLIERVSKAEKHPNAMISSILY